MRIVLSWLKTYVDLDGVSVETLAERWTQAGLEVEGIERIGDWWDRERLLVGAVVAVHPHPNADRLVLADVDHGGGAPHRVVTGAPNLLPLREAGTLDRPLKVVFAREGAELFDGHADGWQKMVLKGRPVRGVMSDAMVCSAKEIGLSEDHEGILILADDAPVGRPLVDVLGDVVFEVAITANMARAMNVVGLARETAAILDRPLRVPEPAIAAPADGDAGDHCAVVIEAPDLCPRYSARIVRDVRLGPSPAWMQRRLTLAGMRPINNIVDVTNYVMLEWGEPLHAFDLDKLVARAGGAVPRIVVRRAAPGERMTTLDGVVRDLDGDTLLIADAAGPVAIAGVMGGADTEVDAGTRNVLLEAAAFDFINVRRTSRMLKLASESAARFGRGVHPALVEPGSVRAADLLRELAAGRVAGGVVDAYPRPPAPVLVTLAMRDIPRTLGVDIPLDAALGILERLGFGLTRHVDGATGAVVAVEAEVPPHRMDVALPVDLVEEIARVYGYDRLPGTRMADPLPPQRDNRGWDVEEAARDALVAAGLQEAISYRLVAPRVEARLVPGASAAALAEAAAGAAGDGAAVPDADSGSASAPVTPTDAAVSAATGPYITLLNPISPERAALRRSILTGLLEAAASNLRYRDRIALFELGRVFHPRPGEGLPDEPRRLGLVMTGATEDRGWRAAGGRGLDFYDAKGAVERVLAALEIEAAWAPGAHPSLHPGRTAEARAGGALLGHVGELHPTVRQQWGLGDAAVAVADLDLDALERAAGQVRPFRPFSPYPAVLRDLAVVVDEATPATAVEAVIRRVGGALVADVWLFDVYGGPQVGAGKKSLAWSLALQAADKTLEGKVADGARERIVKALARELGAEVR